MSLFNTLKTSVSGMAAQSNALGVIGDNIANSSTTGYKEAQAQFETVLGSSGAGTYESGGVTTDIRYGVSKQGPMLGTTSATDLAIQGNGFFVVSKGSDGAQYLTRAGSFVPDSSGNLVNAAGYNLMGYTVSTSGTSTQLSTVNVPTGGLNATASTAGSLAVNLDQSSPVLSATTNTANSAYTKKTSLTVYDNLGNADVYDIYMTKTAGATAADSTTTPPTAATTGTWQVSAYPASDATNGGFPYMSGTTKDTPTTSTLTFDAHGDVVPGASASSTSLSIAVPNGNTVAIDLSKTTQLSSSFAVQSQTMNGNAASALASVKIDKDGTLSAVYLSGATTALYKVPLGSVQSPDNLAAVNGNTYQVSNNSGPLLLSTAGTGAVGSIQSNTLEQSSVDLATELTNMITTQRAYEANSKVLQAASTLLGNLNQIQTN